MAFVPDDAAQQRLLRECRASFPALPENIVLAVLHENHYDLAAAYSTLLRFHNDFRRPSLPSPTPSNNAYANQPRPVLHGPPNVRQQRPTFYVSSKDPYGSTRPYYGQQLSQPSQQQVRYSNVPPLHHSQSDPAIRHYHYPGNVTQYPHGNTSSINYQTNQSHHSSSRTFNTNTNSWTSNSPSSLHTNSTRGLAPSVPYNLHSSQRTPPSVTSSSAIGPNNGGSFRTGNSPNSQYMYNNRPVGDLHGSVAQLTPSPGDYSIPTSRPQFTHNPSYQSSPPAGSRAQFTSNPSYQSSPPAGSRAQFTSNPSYQNSPPSSRSNGSTPMVRQELFVDVSGDAGRMYEQMDPGLLTPATQSQFRSPLQCTETNSAGSYRLGGNTAGGGHFIPDNTVSPIDMRVPPLPFPLQPLDPHTMGTGAGDARPRTGSQDEKAYASALILQQRARMDKLHKHLLVRRRYLDQHSEEVLDKEMRLLQRNSERTSSAEEAAQRTEDNRKLEIQNKMLLMELEHYTSGEAPLGVIDPESQDDNFHQSITDAGVGGPMRLPNGVPNRGEEEEGDNWDCRMCTFKNHPALPACEYCFVPRDSHLRT